MTGKHYGWQKRWRVDLAAHQVAHETGLVVQFSAGQPAGKLLDNPEVQAALLAKHGPHNIGPHLARLMREAGQVYTEALHARH